MRVGVGWGRSSESCQYTPNQLITKQCGISYQEGISKKARQVVNGILKSTDSQSQTHCRIGKAV